MRRLSIPVVLAVLMVISVPAWAKPTAEHIVTWTVGGGSVTLDTYTNEVEVRFQQNMLIQCNEASAWATVEVSGVTTADTVVVDRHGIVGSFSATLEFLPVVVLGACEYEGGMMMTSVAGQFETSKGKAERWRVGPTRYVLRDGTGEISVASFVNEPATVSATAVISR